MADIRKSTDGPDPTSEEGYDFTALPDWDNDFVDEEAFSAFTRALGAPDPISASSPIDEDGPASPQPAGQAQEGDFITALNDWKPIYQRVRGNSLMNKKRKKKRKPLRGKDETREGFVYTLLKWPLLIVVLGWLLVLSVAYLTTRLYVFLYEHFVTMRGRREQLRQRLRKATSYADWVSAANEMDKYLGNDKWKETDDYAYYNADTVRNVRDELRRLRKALSKQDRTSQSADNKMAHTIVEEMKVLVEAAGKDNFVGTENRRLYSETYYGTKHLAQSFVDEIEASLKVLTDTPYLSASEKANLFAHLSRNYGRSAFCLSGGATFAYYHFGVAKALLDASIMPNIITGTSGGALVAALLATRTDEELKKLLVPALANRITACEEPFTVWLRRWWKTGARFDSVKWARKCSWFCRGSITFREAYERTGRVLNVTCIPSDPHSPTVLANYITAPDCVVWSAVLASAAVPGILNPVVLMRKDPRTGAFSPYSFGHKWKDGSLRTDIPLRALNTHFNVNFSIVSQVNPHINLFFFSSRGDVGRPVTHRRGRGWRGGFLGSATEQYLKLDLTKWLKVLRHLELLPRFVGQDWSEIWLQRFNGTVTVWPRSQASDFLHILSDPPPPRLARMLRVGMAGTFPKLKFVANRVKVERLIEDGLKRYPDLPSAEQDTSVTSQRPRLRAMLSQEDLETLLAQARRRNGFVEVPALAQEGAQSSLGEKLSRWWSPSRGRRRDSGGGAPRRGSVIEELGRQSRVFFDDTDLEMDATASDATEEEAA